MLIVIVILWKNQAGYTVILRRVQVVRGGGKKLSVTNGRIERVVQSSTHSLCFTHYLESWIFWCRETETFQFEPLDLVIADVDRLTFWISKMKLEVEESSGGTRTWTWVRNMNKKYEQETGTRNRNKKQEQETWTRNMNKKHEQKHKQEQEQDQEHQ